MWRGGSRREGAGDCGPDLYAPGTPAFRERNRTTTRTIAHGMVREDLGSPPPSIPGEPQPVTLADPEPPEADLASPEPAPAPVHPSPSIASVEKNWRDGFGLNKSA